MSTSGIESTATGRCHTGNWQLLAASKDIWINIENSMTSKFMKQVVAVLSTVAVCAISAQAATPPGMKMTTGIPEGIATPDKLETRIGTLTSFDGVPDEETTRLV